MFKWLNVYMKVNQTILITGGAGFVGSSVARVLLNRGDRILIVDNFNNYYDPRIKRDRIKNLEKDFYNFETDITNYEEMDKIFKTEKIDKILHLAAQAGVRYSLTNPFAYQHSNYLGTLNMLELCRHHDIKDFVFASSSSVYGANKKMPFSEDDKVDAPMSLYAATKKGNEEKAFVYHNLFGLRCTGLRFFTVYGPWGRPDMALFLFTDAIARDKPINVFNYGNMARDFTYVSDIVDGVVSAINRSEEHSYEIFNLAGGRSVKLLDYIAEIEKNLGKRAKKNMMPMQPGDVPVSSADISKAEKMLGYKPQVTVEEGIKRFVEWYQDYYKI